MRMVASMLRMLLVAVCMKMETMMERRTMIRISMLMMIMMMIMLTRNNQVILGFLVLRCNIVW